MSLFGPQNANAATALPDGTQRQRYGAQQTYVKDASAPGMSDGTVLDAAFYNRIISNLEYVVSQGGAAGLPPGSVNALHQGILGVIGEGAPGNLQTVAQLAAAINDDPQVWTTLTGQINACVRFDKNQTLSPSQVLQFQQNVKLMNVAFTGNYADLNGKPALGSAAFLNVGTGANQIVQLGSDSKLPAIDGSKLTGIASTQVSGLGTAATKNVGVAAGNVVQLDATTGKLPAVDGSQLTNISVAGVVQPVLGQCRLSLNGGNLSLNRFRGKYLTVAGTPCIIPSAGVTLAATGLTAGTLYYIYATKSGGTVNALVASTNGHSTDTTAGNEGVEIMTGDNTKTLVGMARPIAGPAWTDTSSQRFVRSWFNRPPLRMTGAQTGSSVGLNATPQELAGPSRCEFLAWADEGGDFSVSGGYYSSTAGLIASLLVFLDNSQTGYASTANTDGSGRVLPLSTRVALSPFTEGYHYVTPAGSVSSGSAFAYNVWVAGSVH